MKNAGVILLGTLLIACLPTDLVAQNVTTKDAEQSQVNMSPNPFREHVTLRLPENGQRYKVQVFNNIGQLIYAEKLQGGANTIVTQNWAPVITS